MAQARLSRLPRLFDPAEAAFPEPRSTGQAVAVPLCADDDRPGGILFVITRANRGLPPADLRIVEAVGTLVTSVVTAQLHIADLELRLARIAALSGRPGSRGPRRTG